MKGWRIIMRKIGVYILIISLLMVTGCTEKEWIQNMVAENTAVSSYDINMKRDLLCLLMSYPDNIAGIQREKDNRVYLIMKSGKKILYDDKKTKGYQEKLANPDLQDMMEQIYPFADITKLMDKGFDPGRIRVYTLLKEVYGSSNKQIQSNLTNVKMGYKNYPFNKNNGAADQLRNTMKELNSIAQNKQSIYSFLFPASGTFNYRYIAGTNRLSPHSFGIAVDLKRDKRDYWKWASREEGEKRLKSYPREIVEVFERHGFIWGGKWGHFDILHFEYRPELIMKSKYFSKEPTSMKKWYVGLSSLDDSKKSYIKMIDEALK